MDAPGEEGHAMAQTAEKFLLSRLSRAGFAGLIIIAIASALLGDPLMSAVAAAAAGVVISGRNFHPARKNNPGQPFSVFSSSSRPG